MKSHVIKTQNLPIFEHDGKVGLKTGASIFCSDKSAAKKNPMRIQLRIHWVLERHLLRESFVFRI